MDKVICSLLIRSNRVKWTESIVKNGYKTCVKRFHISSRCDVELTSVRYPKLKRGNYSKVTDADVAMFERILPGAERVITEPSELEGYNTDWIKNCRGASQLLLKPKTTDDMSAILKVCNERNLAVVPQGGNTGLVGGSVPVFDEVIISTQQMNEIISLDTLSGILMCQAGCILGNLDNYVSEHNLTMPIDLGAKGSCHIGGNLATNAGGLRLLRYGSLHGSVLGLEAVLPDGEVLDCMSSLRKDNTGYDVKQLFIGSEGTLGIITKAAILCPQKPQAVNVAFLGVDSFSRVLEVFKETKKNLAEILSAFEFLDAESLRVGTDNLKLTSPISDHPFYVLIETSGSNSAHDEEKLTKFLESMMESGKVLDGTVAAENSKIQHIWNLRERVAEGLMHDGYCYKYDVSLPLENFYGLVSDMRDRLGDKVTRVVGYGHVGDGNLHLNATTPEYNTEVMELIEPFVYDWVAKYRGSISAEHGLGFKKRQFIYHSKSRSAVTVMKNIKGIFDPKGIMNPYKTLP
ncbi:D-2-hydroxyglutarate dehydrogenase, mitochondrial-like, partial [Mercenaria mercenaria]|uniref:D-2-hydroxyglutarate dehydrogenase, mitochondrial-like n=1 Tax=Mercenaria mercenaria TaxID=6596 RepID=UPI00234EEA7C